MAISVADAGHLLRRTGFGGSTATYQALAAAASSRADAVERVLDVSANPPAARPALAVGDEEWPSFVAVQRTWLDAMRTVPVATAEKMTLFWHGHFAVNYQPAYLAQGHLDILRAYGLGHVTPLLQAVALDPAMLLFLDNASNWAGHPNENFARELMELYGIGLDEYTLTDVREGARAWTGYSLDWDAGVPYRHRLYAGGHDTTPKTIFGITREWTGPQMIEEMTRGVKRDACARFLARKIWSFLAYPDPEPDVLAAITGPFATSDLDVTTLLRTILNHPRFWSQTARQGLVKSPVEFIVHALRCTGIDAAAIDAPWRTGACGQTLFGPPSVAGWKPNRYWLNPATLWERGKAALAIANHLQPYWLRLGDFLAGVVAPGVSTASGVQMAFDAFGIDSPCPTTRARLETIFQRDKARGWDEGYPVRNLIWSTLMAPEMHLA